MRTLSTYLALVVLLIASPAVGQTTQAPSDQSATRPYNMLVLGDSISWGQGLKKEGKSWYQVKVWLEKTTGRIVTEKIEAHSGAVIERSSVTDSYTSTNQEVNVAQPTLHEEIDNALRSYSDRSQVDLVLLSACGNDVGIVNLLNASSVEEIDRMTEQKCGAPVEKLLRRIATSFPAARVILTGYYPFFSEKTRMDFIVKAMVRRFFKTTAATPKMSSREVFERLTANSRRWYETSNKTLAEAVRKVNAEAGEGQRVMFARIDFPPDHSFEAPKTRLWGFNRSPFRMVLLLLSFGKIVVPANDEVRGQRTASCDEAFTEQPNETAAQKKERKSRRMFCRYASLGHPNRKGALVYVDAITSLLKASTAVNAH
jgi:lysophospholipase L1-like esterase